jgi:hypothetical protein
MQVAKYYNKKVKVMQFAEGDLVCKALLPIGTKYSTFGKWSPNGKVLFGWLGVHVELHTS